MKKIIISLLVVTMFFINFNSLVYAEGIDEDTGGGSSIERTTDDESEGSGGSSSSGSTTDDGSWVQKAFSATADFLNGDIDSESTGSDAIDGLIDGTVDTFSNIIKAANRVLLVTLAGLSMIALSVVGVKYMMGGADPGKRKDAAESMKTVFTGMAYGFGAYLIWNIAMMVVRLIISALS